MKSKNFKIGVPIMVFMMAIAFAFATEKDGSNLNPLISGYIFENNECKPASRECNNDGFVLCTQGTEELQVYMSKVSETLCAAELTHWEN